MDDLRSFLLEERFPDRWQPRVTARLGLTMTLFNVLVAKVELGIEETSTTVLRKAKEKKKTA